MSVKYVCPQCESALKYWKQYGFNKEQLINKNTGALNKTIKKNREYPLYTQGLSCTNCDFIYYNTAPNDVEYEHLNHIFDNI
jgi:glutaredoxin